MSISPNLVMARQCIPVVSLSNPYVLLRNSYILDTKSWYSGIAGLVRDLFRRSIDLGRSYARSGNKAELYEALRLMGTGLHCLEGVKTWEIPEE